MKTFREFVEQNRKYIAIVYDGETQENLRNWCKENGFDLSKSYGGKDQKPEDFEFHTTVFYSENEMKLKNETVPLTKGEAFVSKFKLLGPDKNIPVLVIDSPDIKDIRAHYEQLGLKDKWPDYIPHISLSYVRKDYDLNNMKLPEFRMKFGTLKIENINEDI